MDNPFAQTYAEHLLNLLDSKINPGLQILESEHKKGEDMTQVTSTRFLMRYEKYEQERLF
jgi:hypothetical protein